MSPAVTREHLRETPNAAGTKPFTACGPGAVVLETVAGSQPSINQLCFRDFRLIMVAETDVRASNKQFAKRSVFSAITIDKFQFNLRRMNANTSARHRTTVDWRPKRTAAFG